MSYGPMKPSQNSRRRRTKAEPGSRLSELRQTAHRAFDAHWEFGGKTRSEAYLWLADQMKMDPLDCHMGMMDEDECEWVIALCRGEPVQPFIAADDFEDLLALKT